MSSSSSSKTSPPPTRRCPPCCNKRARMRRVPVQATLEDFFKALRGSDLEIHLNAQVDAARAVELVGWSDRALLKSALGTTLAKTTVDRALFDEAFDRFFRFSSFETPARPGGRGPARRPTRRRRHTSARPARAKPQKPDSHRLRRAGRLPGQRRPGLVAVVAVGRLGGAGQAHAGSRARGGPDRHLVLHAKGFLHPEDPAGHGPGTAGPRNL